MIFFKRFFLLVIFLVIFLAPLKLNPELPSGLKINSPAPFSKIYEDKVEVSGRISHAKNLAVNGQKITCDSDGNFITKVKLPVIGRNNLFFTALAGNNLVNYVLPLVRIKTFFDIENLPEKKAIETLATLKITGDLISEDFFRPKAEISRADFCIWLLKSLGEKNPTRPTKPSFNDVSEDHFAYPFIELAVRKKLAKGSPGNFFYPEGRISRGEAVVWVLRSQKLIPFESIKLDKLRTYQSLALKYGFFPPHWIKEKYELDFKKPLNRAEAAWLLSQLKSVKVLYRLLFEVKPPLIKSLEIVEKNQDSEKIFWFKIKLQLNEADFTKNNFEVFLSFSNKEFNSIKLLPENEISPADEVIYSGFLKTRGSLKTEDLFPVFLCLLEESGQQENFVFSNISEIKKIKENVKKESPEILKIEITPCEYSRKNNHPVLVEISLNPQTKKFLKKIWLDLEEIGKPLAPVEDDGLLGDKKANDNIYSLLVRPAPGIIQSEVTIPVIIEDQRGFKQFENLTLKIVE